MYTNTNFCIHETCLSTLSWEHGEESVHIHMFPPFRKKDGSFAFCNNDLVGCQWNIYFAEALQYTDCQFLVNAARNTYRLEYLYLTVFEAYITTWYPSCYEFISCTKMKVLFIMWIIQRRGFKYPRKLCWNWNQDMFCILCNSWTWSYSFRLS